MATIFSHAVSAIALGHLYAARPVPPRFWALSIICSMLPDADVIGFFFGIRYGDMLGHRGLTHSLLFAFIVGLAVTLTAFREPPEGVSRWSLIIYFTIVTFSHPLLDALTNGGRGVAIFAPFYSKRYFFPWRPIEVSPIGTDFFSSRGLSVILSEFVWIWIPSIATLLVVWLYRRR